jgi:hypothetical protein
LPGADSREDHVRVALTWIGGLALLPAYIGVALEHHAYGHTAATEPGVLAVGWSCAILLPLGFAYLFRRGATWMNLAAAIWVVGLNLAAQARLDILLYGWCALGSASMVAWGIHEFRAERINLGMSGFALTIVFFFFSSVMDKLGRSASLMRSASCSSEAAGIGKNYAANWWRVWPREARNDTHPERPGSRCVSVPAGAQPER